MILIRNHCIPFCLALAFSWGGSASAQQEGEEDESSTGEGSVDQEEVQALADKVEQLEQQLADLKAQMEQAEEEAELKALLEAADEELGDDAVEEEIAAEDTVFKSGARALQGLNPEISVTGDMVATLYMNEDFYILEEAEQHAGHVHGGVQRSGLEIRSLGVAFQSNLDPFSFMKFVLAVHHGNFGVCEAYITWAGAIPHVTLTMGKFHQQFGVINRWHEHGFDQVDRPLSHKKFFGSHGLVGTGISMKIMIPKLWAHAEELTIEVTNGENEKLFSGEYFSIPTVLAHLKNYWDLSNSTYLELGLTGVWGLNNQWGFVDDSIGQLVNEGYRHTAVAGADLNLVWIPMGMEKYRGVIWRTEFLYLHKQVEGSGGLDRIDAFAGYTYLDVRTGPYVILGARFDIGQIPEVGTHDWFWQVSPYITIWQSHFAFFRLQYNATWESGRRDPIHSAMFQTVFAAGPHKHEKY